MDEINWCMTTETITGWKCFKGPVINCREGGYETGVWGGGGQIESYHYITGDWKKC